MPIPHTTVGEIRGRGLWGESRQKPCSGSPGLQVPNAAGTLGPLELQLPTPQLQGQPMPQLHLPSGVGKGLFPEALAVPVHAATDLEEESTKLVIFFLRVSSALAPGYRPVCCPPAGSCPERSAVEMPVMPRAPAPTCAGREGATCS